MIPFRVLFVAVAALALAAAGCRPANPLDWRISARTPTKFEEWRDEDFVRLPERERKEFNRAFDFIASTMPVALNPENMDKTGNPLCRRLDRRTIRSVILEGYDLEKRTLYARISTESDNIIRNAQLVDKAETSAQLARFEKVRVAQTKNIEAMNARLAEIAARLKELDTTPQ